MYVHLRERGWFVPTFGMALAVMFVLCAAMASGATASTWHVNGSTFSSKESVSWSGGPIKISRPEWEATISCSTVSGTSEIKESSKSSGAITLSGCAVENLPSCTVKPVSLGFNGYLVDSGGQAYERYDVSGNWWIGGTCGAIGSEGSTYVYGSLAAAVGVPDAVHSPRVFSAAAEKATGAKGLQFSGGSWYASGEAAASLAGANAGKDFGIGIGGTWKPEAPATWTVDGSPFGGSEEVLWEGSGPIYLERSGYVVVCNGMGTFSAGISGGDDSAAEALIYECGIAAAPKCSVGDVYLTLDGQIGWQENNVMEKADAGGYMEMYGTGCPFTGAKSISGSVGAFYESEPESLTLRRYFLQDFSDSFVNATGLRINGETWTLYAEVDASLYGANAGEAFGVE